jgi:pimeloyl-ACP methyl ester carboxylesterase
LRAEPVRGQYRVRGLDLAYHRWGDPEATPLLCLHGFMDHGQSFAFMVEALAEGYCVIAPDMRGHGESGWLGAGGYYHFYDYFDDVRALVDELKWSKFGIVAHSMGGTVAAGVVAMIPERVRSLVLLEGMGPPFSEIEDLPQRLRRWSNALRKPSYDGDVSHRRASRGVMGGLEDAATRLQRFNSRLSDSRALRLAQTFTEPYGEGICWRQDPLHRTPAAKPFLQTEADVLWGAIECPVLSLIGAQSVWVPGELDARHAALKSLTTVDIQEAGHNLHHDRPELVASLVHSWMQDEGLPADFAEINAAGG